MPDWKLHTPNGVSDVLPKERAVKKEIEDTLWKVFRSFGYVEVESPSFEYYDCYSGESGQITQEKLFKFFDEQGRILALRPDFTTSIARMAATKKVGDVMPLRYMYTGNVFRAEHTDGARRREITQSGIELIGSYSPQADAEVIAAAMEAVESLGIEEFSMEIGQVAFFNGLVEQCGLDAETTEKLRSRIDSKDSQGIKTLVEKLNIEDEIKQIMIELPYLFGGPEVLDKANVPGLNETSKVALDNIRKIYELLCLYNFEDYISIDLGMLQSIDYYTGSIFKCYTHGVGFPIAAGGRYDHLMGQFGMPKGAVGCAFGVNRLMQVYEGTGHIVPTTLIYAEKDAEGIAYEVAYVLRDDECLAEMYIGGGSYDDAVKYAVSKQAACIIRVFPDRNLAMHDFIMNKDTEVTVDEFLYDEGYGYSEEEIANGIDIPVSFANDSDPTPQDLGFRQF